MPEEGEPFSKEARACKPARAFSVGQILRGEEKRTGWPFNQGYYLGLGKSLRIPPAAASAALLAVSPHLPSREPFAMLLRCETVPSLRPDGSRTFHSMLMFCLLPSGALRDTEPDTW